MIWEANGAGPDRNYGETAVFALGRKAKNGPKIHFLLSQPPKICLKTDIYLGKGYFFLLTTLPGRGRNMVRVKKCYFFFWPENPDFGPKIRFLIWDPDFCQESVCSPWRWLRLGTFGSIVRLFVSELRPFSCGDPTDAPKSLTPPHCGGTVCQ